MRDYNPETHKRVAVCMRVVYERIYPKDYTPYDIEFHLNESSWCTSNSIRDLQELEEEEDGCLCRRVHYTYVEDVEDEPA